MSESVNPGQSTSRTRRDVAAARAVKALELRLTGMSLDEIATALGYKDRSGVHRAVQGQLAKAKREKASEVVALDLMRLDLLLNAMWDKALKGDTSAFDRVLKVLERRAKYLGLDGQAGSTVEQLQALRELAYADALLRLAAIKDEMRNHLAAAASFELSGLALGLPVTDSPWEEAVDRLDAFDGQDDDSA